jgi:phosphoadenosine phosphosulfate reductase
MIERVAEFNQKLAHASAYEVLEFFAKEFHGRIAFATSLGLEDQVLFRMISEVDPSVFCFTLDTGRLFQETYDLLDLTSKKYKTRIHLFFPDASSVENMIASRGINLFYESIENRKLCCQVRKIEPMKRALAPMDVWISGLRKGQSVTRQEAKTVEWDEVYKKIKINPLIDWTEEDIWNEIKTHGIPYNPLHDQGFPSIGCQPCTRVVAPGEDIRAGRWWWELPQFRECGLHIK